jgi:3-phenylpropionate/trans-cinnamate dioxygenase subunit alpha
MTIDVSQCVDTEHGLVRGEIFHSKEIYEAELKHVFARSWLFLAHEAMIPKAGDFIQNYMGEDPVVVVRQKDGSVRAFLNQCRHRGMRICRADRGNSRAFMCSFHGWTYDIGGNLIAVPHEEEAYPQGLRKENWGPPQVPLLTSYKGFIFGNWDPTAPSFEEYLGDMAWYFDAAIDRYAGGVEPVATHKWVIPANWKFNAEQPASDMIHGEITHGSAFQVLQPSLAQFPDGEEPLAGLPAGNQFSSPYGHGTGWFNQTPRTLGPLEVAWLDRTRDEVAARLGPLRAVAGRGHANIFPNFMWLSNGTMRVTHPRGPEEMEIWAWSFVPSAAPDQVKEEMRVNVLRTFSPAGIFEQDDAENWLEEQRILRGYMARQNSLLYLQHLGNEQMNAYGFPGKTAPSAYAETGARGMYRHWADMMSGRPWPEITELKRRQQAADEQLPSGAERA